MYNFRPLDEKLFITCVNNTSCTDCPLRVGCKIRYDFYAEDLSYETALQLAEIYVMAKMHIPGKATEEAVCHIRRKRECEIIINPHFSYK